MTGSGVSTLTTACCRGRGGGRPVATGAAGFVPLLMEHGGVKAGGGEKKETNSRNKEGKEKEIRTNYRKTWKERERGEEGHGEEEEEERRLEKKTGRL